MSNVDYRLPGLQEKRDGFGNDSDAYCGCPRGSNDGGVDDMLEERVRDLELGLARVETILRSLATKSDVVEVRAELATAESRLIKWIIGSAFAAAAIMIAFLNYTKPATGPVMAVPAQAGYLAPQAIPSPEK